MRKPAFLGHKPGQLLGATILATTFFVFVQDNLLDIYLVEGESMEPTLSPHERVFVSKWAGKLSYRTLSLFYAKTRLRSIRSDLPEVRRGQILAFFLPTEPYDTKRILLKRVVALPGEAYRFEGGRLWINDRLLHEPYLHAPAYTSAQPPLSLMPAWKLPEDYSGLSDFARYAAQFGVGASGRVPPHTLLVLGDNRARSIDSRNFGFVPYNRIVGIVVGNLP